ncbi:vitellin-degrading protease-like [Galleria mellonella]|uniref:Vitellin-degrading protease-like n=1 Tax=Galleria mellonella TaxID=7137 RepID=A0A6J3BQS7_GALME|nr:vitellin-degrading protease-like [Galleria mellonella]
MIVWALLISLFNVYSIFCYRYLPEKLSQTYSYNDNNIHNEKIINITNVPHHALIVHGDLYCSGNLIHSKIVLSAASCFRQRNQNPCIVKVGSSSMIGRGQVINVVEIKNHEYFGYSSRMDNDIAMLVLQKHVEFGPNVKKTILVQPDVALRDGVPVKVSGWGSVNVPPNQINKHLQSDMIILNKEECIKYYGNLMTPSNFCAKYPLERRLSDNGGSAVYRNFLVGILSFGATNKEEPFVAVFTNVSYFYRWIMINSHQLLKKYCVKDVNYRSMSLEYVDNINKK